MRGDILLGGALCVQVLEDFKRKVGVVPHLWKADIDSAFRRIPVKPDDRWLCGIAFMVGGQVRPRLISLFIVLLVAKVWWAQHLGTPFGAVASVHAWERVGAAIAHIARVLLKLPVLRYVDDYWSPERWVS